MLDYLLTHPPLIFAVSFAILYLSARIGVFARRYASGIDEGIRQDLAIVLAATLTLLGLIIGFSFSMATSRYDLRAHYEEEEANAIGSEYALVALLPADDAKKAKSLLADYLDRRISFYETLHEQELDRINAEAATLQAQLWAIIQAHAASQQTPVAATILSGMDKLSSAQGYAEAAWSNRIPGAAWGFMWTVAVIANVIMGFEARRAKSESLLLLVLPLILSVCFYFLADIDNPRGGLIHIAPKNLISLSQSFRRLH